MPNKCLHRGGRGSTSGTRDIELVSSDRGFNACLTVRASRRSVTRWPRVRTTRSARRSESGGRPGRRGRRGFGRGQKRVRPNARRAGRSAEGHMAHRMPDWPAPARGPCRVPGPAARHMQAARAGPRTTSGESRGRVMPSCTGNGRGYARASWQVHDRQVCPAQFPECRGPTLGQAYRSPAARYCRISSCGPPKRCSGLQGSAEDVGVGDRGS